MLNTCSQILWRNIFSTDVSMLPFLTSISTRASFPIRVALCVSLQIQLPVIGEQMEVCSAYSYTVETGNFNLRWGNCSMLWYKTGNFFFWLFPSDGVFFSVQRVLFSAQYMGLLISLFHRHSFPSNPPKSQSRVLAFPPARLEAAFAPSSVKVFPGFSSQEKAPVSESRLYFSDLERPLGAYFLSALPEQTLLPQILRVFLHLQWVILSVLLWTVRYPKNTV